MLDRDEPALREGADDAAGPGHHGGELGDAHGACRERLHDLALATGVAAGHEATPRDREGCPAVVNGLRAIHDEPPLARLVTQDAGGLAGRQHEAQAHGRGRRILPGHPLGKARSGTVEGGLRKHAFHGQHAQGVHALGELVCDVHHISHDRTVRKAHEHGAANGARIRKLVGDGVVKAPVDGTGGYVGNDLCVSHVLKCATSRGQKWREGKAPLSPFSNLARCGGVFAIRTR